MVLVGVEESGFGTRGERLERGLATRGLNGSAAEDLARNLHIGSHLEQIIAQRGKRSYVYGAEILGRSNLFDSFHDLYVFKIMCLAV